MNGAVDRDASTRARIEEHWKASERGDTETEHAIYAADGATAALSHERGWGDQTEGRRPGSADGQAGNRTSFG